MKSVWGLCDAGKHRLLTHLKQATARPEQDIKLVETG